MPDPLRKVRPGELLSISAGTWNKLMEMLAWWQSSDDIGPLRDRIRGSVIMGRNDTGFDLPRRAIVGIGAPLVHPVNSMPPDEFQAAERDLMMTWPQSVRLVTPTTGKYFGVTLSPAPANSQLLIPVVTDGIIATRLFVTSTSVNCADCVTGTVNHLETIHSGTAPILWRQGGTPPVLEFALVALNGAFLRDAIFDITDCSLTLKRRC